MKQRVKRDKNKTPCHGKKIKPDNFLHPHLNHVSMSISNLLLGSNTTVNTALITGAETLALPNIISALVLKLLDHLLQEMFRDTGVRVNRGALRIDLPGVLLNCFAGVGLGLVLFLEGFAMLESMAGQEMFVIWHCGLESFAALGWSGCDRFSGLAFVWSALIDWLEGLDGIRGLGIG